MKPLEALLKEEELVLAKPECDPGLLKYSYDSFPYLYIKPFIDYIKAKADFLDMESKQNSEDEFTGLRKALLSFSKSRVDRLRKEIDEYLNNIEEKYKVKISDNDLNDYLIELSERSLSYVRERLPGILTETYEIEDVFNDKFLGKNLSMDEGIIELSKIACESNQFLRESIKK